VCRARSGKVKKVKKVCSHIISFEIFCCFGFVPPLGSASFIVTYMLKSAFGIIIVIKRIPTLDPNRVLVVQ
jgi:hypothetical protein